MSVSFIPRRGAVRVSYGVGRAVGTAVRRNRLRRRLRVAVAALRGELATGDYLVRAGAAGAGLTNTELAEQVRRSLGQAGAVAACSRP